ncbi:MAG: alpha/beta fold hydrolase [bacterium]
MSDHCNRSHRIRLLALLFCAILASCGGSPDDTPDGAVDGQAADATADASVARYPISEVEAMWSPCSLYEGEDDGLAECASTAMPLRWDEPDGETTFVVAKRLLSSVGGETQLWLVHGGPGASGVMGFPSRMELLQALYPELDVYTLDHRGTGYSSYLECPDQQQSGTPGGTGIAPEEVAACAASLQAQHGDGLAAMSTTNSAIDLAAYIESSRAAGLPVVVWGGSYGTYLAQRFLQIFPDQTDGVVLEGAATPEITCITTDEDSDRVGRDLLDLCAAETACASRLGGDPQAFLADALERRRDGTCQAVPLSADGFRLLLVYLAYYYPIHSVIPAAIHRLHRCTNEDGSAIGTLYNTFFGSAGVMTNIPYSIVLQYHINLSEMWTHPDFSGVDLEQYFASTDASALFYRGLSAAKYALLPDWPTYSDEEYDDGWAAPTIPLLVLQGELDPATPYFRALDLADHYTAPNQYFVSFPHGAHGVTSGTPLPSDPDNDHCAMQLFQAFLRNPHAPLDTSCVADVLPIDFNGSPELAAELFGTGDYWALGVPPPAPRAKRSRRTGLQEAIAATRRRIQLDGSLGRIP